ncbi:restriction endonuclease subunit S [Aeromonas cavernicola]|uniref:Type I restriction endonuclease subunit S n=1 Tax=Aeromonas cavernicola TaxID=1006623 RepID=A0A2H9U761_9GAMM|nr:restriction endonuclease subunit S [Aeromonas cavernicola]PJG59887.1 type I restriction endonuclease subunit S [Aeromonas cavernicola]
MNPIDTLITDHLDLWTAAVRPKSSAGRGSSSKLELTGIKKLRELILELAVRGKLVPQDPSDEPASVLLERIAAEKARLVKEGKIKKPKAMPEISEEEKPFELPEGWEWCRLSELGVFFGGKTPSKMKSDYWGGDIPWVTPKDMKVDYIIESEDYVTDLAVDDGLTLVKPNSLLFVARSGILRRKFPVAITTVTCTVNQDLKVLQPFDCGLTPYIHLMMKGFEQYILKNLTKVGTTVESLVFDEFSINPFILPPLFEQQRIVAKVDELMALCDQLEQCSESQLAAHQTLVETLLGALLQPAAAAEGSLTDSCDAEELSQNWARLSTHFDTLFTTEASIDALKQTILQLAVMGKLVPQDLSDEPAAALLERIAAEKARLVKEKKIKKEKPLPAISEEEKPFELPNGWEWCRLNDLALSSEAGWSPQCEANPRENKNWGVLKVSAVTWGTFKPDENKVLPNALEPKPEYEVQSGDFLISRANTAELVARAVVVPDEVPPYLMMSDKIIRFKFSKSILADYINLVNNSAFSRTYYAKVAGGTSSSMKNVSRVQIQNLVIALPPMLESREIIKKINQLMTLCDQLKSRLQTSQQTQLALAESLVAGALA